jgi:hypothetical protein
MLVSVLSLCLHAGQLHELIVKSSLGGTCMRFLTDCVDCRQVPTATYLQRQIGQIAGRAHRVPKNPSTSLTGKSQVSQIGRQIPGAVNTRGIQLAIERCRKDGKISAEFLIHVFASATVEAS